MNGKNTALNRASLKRIKKSQAQAKTTVGNSKKKNPLSELNSSLCSWESDSDESSYDTDEEEIQPKRVRELYKEIKTIEELEKLLFVEIFTDGRWYCAKVLRRREGPPVSFVLKDLQTEANFDRAFQEYNWRTCGGVTCENLERG